MNQAFDEGVASVDITSDNQAAFDEGAAPVDITSDNQAASRGAASVDTTPDNDGLHRVARCGRGLCGHYLG